MSIYTEWGFRSSPFQTTALPANELGETLLVGRSVELDRLMKRLRTPPMASTVEGPNGVGKTSLINVATYKCFKRFFEKKGGPLLIPCETIFQLSPTATASEFELTVLMAVAQTLIGKAREIETSEGFPNVRLLDRWLNNPQYDSYHGGIQAAVGGLSVGKSGELNTTNGFLRSGLRQTVTAWLKDIFPAPEHGGVVCVIDNLELLQTSQNARQVLEEIRDLLFTVPGLRWVLCGALGIVRSVASTPRLKGYLHNPIEISGVDKSEAREILESRIRAFATSEEPAYVPITAASFENLYRIFNRNIRHALSYLNDYCLWVSDNQLPKTDDEKDAAYRKWLMQESDLLYDAARDQLRPRAWRTFEHAIKVGGAFSPSDYEDFGFNRIEALRPHVKDLEEAGLLQSTQDEADKRRKIINITANGWLVAFARFRENLPGSHTPERRTHP